MSIFVKTGNQNFCCSWKYVTVYFRNRHDETRDTVHPILVEETILGKS